MRTLCIAKCSFQGILELGTKRRRVKAVSRGDFIWMLSTMLGPGADPLFVFETAEIKQWILPHHISKLAKPARISFFSKINFEIAQKIKTEI